MAKWGKLSFAQKKCVSTVGMLMQKTEMVKDGDRIGIAVSGGVDSFVLIRTMLIRQAIIPFNIELMVLHVNPGFIPDSHYPLSDWCRENGIAAHIELTNYGPRAHGPENKKICMFLLQPIETQKTLRTLRPIQSYPPRSRTHCRRSGDYIPHEYASERTGPRPLCQ